MEGMLEEAGEPHWESWLRGYIFAWGIRFHLPQGHSTPHLFFGQQIVTEASLSLPLSLGLIDELEVISVDSLPIP